MGKILRKTLPERLGVSEEEVGAVKDMRVAEAKSAAQEVRGGPDVSRAVQAS